MKLTFLGTRGYIDEKSRLHKKHSSLKITYKNMTVMIDCGEDWQGELDSINPNVIVLTHAHPDHAGGLKEGTSKTVYMTKTTGEKIESYPIENRKYFNDERTFKINEIEFQAFSVEHSTIAPAVGFKIKAGQVCLFYAPDLVYIHNREKAMEDVQLYIGDGATIDQSFVRRRKDRLIGHTPIRTQLTWCKKFNISKAIFTHCGSEIVKGDERRLGAKIRRYARERGVKASIAHDGQHMTIDTKVINQLKKRRL